MMTTGMRKAECGNRDSGIGIRSAAALAKALAMSAAIAVTATLNAQNRTQPPANPTSTALPTQPGVPGEVSIAPVECWWKTDRSAVRVGERFSLTLTCAVLDTDRVKAVVDESGLAPSALHLVPFEILDGRRFRDVRNGPRRFFQYQYGLRVLGEEFFGREVALPKLQLSYRVQNALAGGSALAGREQQYSLRPVPVRVLSLVPRDASEIRDTPPETFGDVEARLFRSNVLLIVAAVALVFAALVTVWALVRARLRRPAALVERRRAVSPALALRAASRELAAVYDESQREGWNSGLAGRAAAAARLAGAIALNRPIAEMAAHGEAREGQVLTWRGLRRAKVALSAAVTPAMAPGNGVPSSAEWDAVSRSLKVFVETRYGRGGAVDATALDAAVSDVQDVVKRLRLSLWRRMGRSRPAAAVEHGIQTWAR